MKHCPFLGCLLSFEESSGGLYKHKKVCPFNPDFVPKEKEQTSESVTCPFCLDHPSFQRKPFFAPDGHLKKRHPLAFESAKKYGETHRTYKNESWQQIKFVNAIYEDHKDDPCMPSGNETRKRPAASAPDRPSKKTGPKNKYQEFSSYCMPDMDDIHQLSHDEFLDFTTRTSIALDGFYQDDDDEEITDDFQSDQDLYRRRRMLFDSMTPMEHKAVDIYLDQCEEDDDQHNVMVMAGIYITNSDYKECFHLGPKCGSSKHLKRMSFIPFGVAPCASCFDVRNMEPCEELLERGQHRTNFFQDRLDPTKESLGLTHRIMRLFHTGDEHKDAWASYVRVDELVKAFFSVTKKREATRRRDATEKRQQWVIEWKAMNVEHLRQYHQNYLITNREYINMTRRMRYNNDDEHRMNVLSKHKNDRDNNRDHFLQKERASHQRNKINRNIYSAQWRATQEGFMKRIRYGAEVRGIPFQLTEDELFLLVNGDCAYCGVEATVRGNGVDRVNSNRPYIMDNCRSCCFDCNVMKGTLPLYDFIQKCINVAVYTHHKYQEDIDGMEVNRRFIIKSCKGSTYAQHKANLSNRHMTSDLSNDQYNAIRMGICEYCGESDSTIMTVDRVDSADNYTLQNSVSACYGCNMLKMNLPREDFERQCIQIAQHMLPEFKTMDFNTSRDEHERSLVNFTGWVYQYNAIYKDEHGKLHNQRKLNFDSHHILSDHVYVAVTHSRVYHTYNDCFMIKARSKPFTITCGNMRMPCSFCRPLEHIYQQNRTHELDRIKYVFDLKY